jgi:outer membrane protein assembly factor BamE (lipoprotein component of BamABCDE complex)
MTDMPNPFDDRAKPDLPPRNPAAPGSSLTPHRGEMVMVLGVLSLVIAPLILGPIIWFMARHDLKEMAAGRMDSEGRSKTQLARILAIIATLLWPVIMCTCCGGSLLFQAIQGSKLIPAIGSHRITKGEFDRVQMGMTKDEVTAILGRPARAEYDEYQQHWYWYEKDGRTTFNVTFNSRGRVDGVGYQTPD